MQNFELTRKQFDLIIIGSGGAGLMAAIAAYDAGVKNIAIISKVIPTNSHTVAAKGGINAALGNVIEDDWKWHAFDTIKGSDYLADANAVELLCKGAAAAIVELEKMGVVFSRDEAGKIAQRAYGGQTTDFGNGNVAYRACYSKDKTGQTILHTLYSQALKRGIKFFSEYFVTDLLMEEKSTSVADLSIEKNSIIADVLNDQIKSSKAAIKQCRGCLAIDLNSGKLVSFESAQTIIASGGYSQIYRNTTSSLICTGDGGALIFKAGLPLQDMEFVQFHPTGIAKQGFLISEAARGEGAYLLNAQGERFMKNYAPKMMELSSRDIISRAIATEIIEGRGCGLEKNYIDLDLRHLSEETLQNKLPGIVEIAKNFAKVDVKKDFIPVAPTAHYTMGGIPTNIDCVVLDFSRQEVEGLMAVGEAACVSVHGANRLGCNSLLDLIIFGKIAGKKSAEKICNLALQPVNGKLEQGLLKTKSVLLIIEEKIANLKRVLEKKPKSSICEQSAIVNEKPIHQTIYQIKTELQNINEKYLGVFRVQNLLEQAKSELQDLFEEFKNVSIKNKNLLWNDELVGYFELENLFLNSFAAIYSALERKESRGAHYRDDFSDKDDKNWLCHSVVKATQMAREEIEWLQIDFTTIEVDRSAVT